MADITSLLNLIKPDIEQIENSMRADIDSLSTEIDDLHLEILQYGLFSGGKRFRPLLAVIAARLCNCDKGEIYKLAIAFEYLHLATLFHDDVIDKADTRRGKPSVSNAYGRAAAILAGDFLHARSMAIIGRYGGGEALEIFCNATGGMVNGEFLQLRNSTNYNQSEDDYFKVIHGKTALLIAATTQIGALYGGASRREQQSLKEFGIYLGYTFQIVDDLLDYKGDAKKTGKPVGNDLIEGKMTLPLILTLKKADSKDTGRIIDILNSLDMRHQCFGEVCDLIEKYDCFEQTSEKAKKCLAHAIKELDVFSQNREKEKQILTALAQYVLVREK